MRSFKFTGRSLFVIVLLIFFGISGVLSNKYDLAHWLLSLVVFLIGTHWISAYLWKTDMHNHLGKVRYYADGKNRTIRLLSATFGVFICVYSAFC